MDRVDASRRRGVPIVYVPQVSEAARRQRNYAATHAMPSSDLVLAENGCERSEGGGRFVRIVTCTDGWVCIVIAHYERQLHGGVYPVGANGALVDDAGRPHLERQLVPGVELLRCVCFQMARVDDFHFAMQAAYDAAGGAAAVAVAQARRVGAAPPPPTSAQERLVRELYEAFAPPLDERLRMLHPWLPAKDDTPESEPFGARGRWCSPPGPP